MKVLCWNVNSIRARIDRLNQVVAKHQPDVVCLQELKCSTEDFPWSDFPGFHGIVYGQKRYNGVALLASQELSNPVRGLSQGGSRCVGATVAGTRILSIYAPNGQDIDSPEYAAKLAWYAELKELLLKERAAHEDILVVGDFNIAYLLEDVYAPELFGTSLPSTLPERNALQEIFELGFKDCFENREPDSPRFTFWDYRQLSFPKNLGYRIDLALATEALWKRSLYKVLREERKGSKPSDHAPILLTL